MPKTQPQISRALRSSGRLFLIPAASLLLFSGCQQKEVPAPSTPATSAPAAERPAAPAACSDCTPVSADNFVRAESDLYIGGQALKRDAFGKFHHDRNPAPLDNQTVIRLNRDTLYSAAVFDLDGGLVTITLPDSGSRFMSMQVINQDEYTPMVVYGKGTYTLSKDKIGTRYAVIAIRTLVNPDEPGDLDKVHQLQDAIRVNQKSVGTFEVPKWDPVSQKKVRDALLQLAETLPDTRGMFGSKQQTDPVRHLIGAASAWGGNPEKDALYLNVVPAKNDGKTIYRLHVANNVPVDGFWSISLYNAKGYFVENSFHAYTLNNLTAKKDADGSVNIQFGGCDGKIPNCLPVMSGWNYMVRLYRPRAEILSGQWKFPEAQPVQ